MLEPKVVRVDTGRCEGGTFVRVVHVPFGVSCERGLIGGCSSERVQAELLQELERLVCRDESKSTETT